MARDLQAGDYAFIRTLTGRYVSRHPAKYAVEQIDLPRIHLYSVLKPERKKVIINEGDGWVPERHPPDNTYEVTFLRHIPPDQMRLIDLIKANPGEKFDWYDLSRNPNITLEDVQDNPNLPWNLGGLSGNPNVTFDDVVSNLQSENPIRWVMPMLSQNPNITIDDIEDNLQSETPLEWDWYRVSQNPNVTVDIIEANLQSPTPIQWDWDEITTHINITMADIEANLQGPNPLPWNMNQLSNNWNITLADINNHPEVNWDFDNLSEVANISMEELDADLRSSDPKPWNWEFLSGHRNMTWEFVRDHPNLPWDWHWISWKVNVPIVEILQDLRSPNPKPWDITSLSSNPHITIRDVEEGMKSGLIKWDWRSLSTNPGITIDDIQSNSHLPWKDFSSNPNIRIADIAANLQPRWWWKRISRHRFGIPEHHQQALVKPAR